MNKINKWTILQLTILLILLLASFFTFPSSFSNYLEASDGKSIFHGVIVFPLLLLALWVSQYPYVLLDKRIKRKAQLLCKMFGMVLLSYCLGFTCICMIDVLFFPSVASAKHIIAGSLSQFLDAFIYSGNYIWSFPNDLWKALLFPILSSCFYLLFIKQCVTWFGTKILCQALIFFFTFSVLSALFCIQSFGTLI